MRTAGNSRTSESAERPISEMARRHDLNPRQLARWVLRGRRLRDGHLLFPNATRTPGGWRISPRALRAFLDAITADARGVRHETPDRLSPTDRSGHARAEAALEAAGL